LYTIHKIHANILELLKLSEYCGLYERLENSELYALLKNSDKGSAGLSNYSDNSANGVGDFVYCILYTKGNA
jgi:hypothetical protein